VSLRRKLAVIALVYVIEGFPMGVFLDVLPVFFRRMGVSKAEIGFLAGLSVAWSLKVLWSPLIDRFGLRRQWISGANVAMAAALLLVARGGAETLTAAIWLAVSAYCVASATQDIAIDAYTIGLVDRGEEGPANAMRMTGYRLGMLLAGGVLLFLPRWIGWPETLAVAAGLHAAMAAAVYTVPRVEVPVEARREMWHALRRWLGRQGALPVFLFVLLYRVGDSAMAPMVKPFWVDRGFLDEEIGAISTGLGVGAIIAGGWIAAGVVSRLGIGRSLWVIGVFALASNLAYAAAAGFPAAGRPGVYAASLTESFCSGMAGVAFMSYLMRICQKEHAAVQYALLTAIYNLAGSLLRIPSGVFAEALGYAGYFALTAAFALPAFAFLPSARRWIGPESG
jgi:PAT family beta-lactamase induction signal transducer AmpG